MDEHDTDTLRLRYDVRSSPERRIRPQSNPNVSAPRRTFTMDDETYDRLARGRHCGGQPGRVLGQERLLDGDVYERLTNMAQQARVESQEVV